MKHVGHFIAGELFPADSGSQIFNPSNGKLTAIAAIGTSAEEQTVAAEAGEAPAATARGSRSTAPRSRGWAGSQPSSARERRTPCSAIRLYSGQPIELLPGLSQAFLFSIDYSILKYAFLYSISISISFLHSILYSIQC